MKRQFDVLVVGSGIAGLFFALRVAPSLRVGIVTKKERLESSTNYAQGGVAAVFGSDDSPELHEHDTLVAGAGLCHRDAVRALVREGPDRIRELMELGARFTREGGRLSLAREGGHSRRRIVRADDLTGREIERALLDAVAQSANVDLLENHIAVDLLLSEQGSRRHCSGAYVMGPDDAQPQPITAGAVVLASGGCGQIYRHTTNPAIATGDGVAMAYRAGAAIANMEFVQFHPTALYPASGRTFLISEAVRGEGAILRRRDGSAFMGEYHPQGSLAPRDVVARAIDREMKLSGDPYVLLDCSTLSREEIAGRFPNILRETSERGVDMRREPLPVVPAAHYLCGGVLTDTRGRSTLPGLYAIGETAATGVHGANRLASNSLLEALVFAARAAEVVPGFVASCAEHTRGAPVTSISGTMGPVEGAILVHDREEIRGLMWDLVGIVRTDERLAMAADRLRQMMHQYEALWSDHAPSYELAELRNLVTTSLLVVESARARHESRGLHFNLDHPYRDNERFLHDTVLRR